MFSTATRNRGQGEEFAGDRSSPNYRRVDKDEGIYPGLKEDMESTEVFVHEFN